MARLIEELKKLPGIGTKSAQRLAFHVLRSSSEDAEALSVAIRELKLHLRLCSVCNNITDVDPCGYCTNAVRNQRLVCVVEEPTNIATIEKTRSYNGVYHVLHGTLSPIGGVGPEQLRSALLSEATRIVDEEISQLTAALVDVTERHASGPGTRLPVLPVIGAATTVTSRAPSKIVAARSPSVASPRPRPSTPAPVRRLKSASRGQSS